MQIVEQTKRRSGWRVYRTLAALGLPRSVYYAWKSRENLEDRVGKPCRVYWTSPVSVDSFLPLFPSFDPHLPYTTAQSAAKGGRSSDGFFFALLLRSDRV